LSLEGKIKILEDEEEDVGNYWMNLREQEDAGK
jgi:hypothetical protein